jgi:predicted MFS family arabinose efflux permease
MAFVAIGFSWGAVTVILSLLFLKDVRQADAGRPEAADADSDGLTVSQAMRSGPLQRIALATFITMFLGVGVQVHQVPLLTETGMPRQEAAYLVSLGGLAGIAGKLITGWLMDRANAGMVGAITLGVSAIAYGTLIDGIRTVPITVIAMMVIGYASAAKLQICAYMTTRYAGMRNFGKIFGFMASLIALGGGLGPFVAGLIFDVFGTYNPLLIASVGGTLLSAAMLLGLGNYPRWRPSEREPALA